MKFVQKITFDLENLKYYRDELGWNVNSIEEVVKCIKDWTNEELPALLGCAIDYKCWIEKTSHE